MLQNLSFRVENALGLTSKVGFEGRPLPQPQEKKKS